MTFLLIAIPVCVVAVFGTLGLATLYDLFFGKTSDFKTNRTPKCEDWKPKTANENLPAADNDSEIKSWLREVDAMDR